MNRPLLVLLPTALSACLAACGSGTPTGSTTSTAAAPSTSFGTATGTTTSSVATDVNPPGDIPDTQAFITTADPQSRFNVKVPEGWARQDQGTATTFSDHYNNIRLDTVAATTAPTVDSASSAEVPRITATGAKVADVKVTATQRTAGPVVLITYTADSAPNPVTGKVAREAVERYEFWRSGVEAIVTLAAPVGSDNVDPWRVVTNSFQWR